ncbi:serine hydrolase, partial [bacterium]|nr:serine hydrolase [bacterium]
NKIVWTDGFGVTNRLTDKPVSSKTVFEVASISKVVTAYIALRLIEQGKLSLDKPVKTYLKKTWLPPSKYDDKITLRHLLSHSSGLGDDVLFMDKNIAFEPGSGFLYSGIGFLYVQEVIEQLTGNSLEKTAQEYVFIPLVMSGSSFVNEASVMNHLANGHMHYTLPLLAFLIPFIIILVIVSIISLIANRIIKRSWRLSLPISVIVFVISFVLTESLLYLFIGKPFPNLIWANIICAIVFLSSLILLYLLFRRLITFLLATRRKRVLTAILTTIWLLIIIVIFLKIANSINGPILRNNSTDASAVGSLRASAPDLASFLIELANPRYLSEDIASRIDSTQVNINQDFSWGLGIGIQHSKYGNAIWQNGITFGYRSVMVIYPGEGHGVVVLTNIESGLPAAYDIAARALGGKAQWESF